MAAAAAAAAGISIGPQTTNFRNIVRTDRQLFSPHLSPPAQIPIRHHHRLTISCSSRGMCHVAHAVKPRGSESTEELLKGVTDKATAETVKNILEMARRASSRREILHTDFLTPPVVKESLLAVEKLADIKAVSHGGYPQAERCRLSIGHPEIMTSIPDVVAALSILGNFGFEPCSHGDFLGAILGTGIIREKLGDILLQGEKGAQVLVVPELVEFLTSTLDKQRGRARKLVSVHVNWYPLSKNGAAIKTGDIISVSGKGRLKIGEIVTTRKGKFAVELIRYL